MITMVLDWHDFLFAIEGFARGSHLRQHIWHEIVTKYISQMSDRERDNIWFFLRRDIWPIFFKGKSNVCGDDDFLHCMAAMQRNNYATIVFRENGWTNGRRHRAYCYRFQNTWHVENRFNTFVPDEWVDSVSRPEKGKALQPLYIEKGKESWWTNLDVYNLPVSEVRKMTVEKMI